MRPVGGVHNLQIMRRLSESLPGIDVKTTAEFGVDPDAKEAIAFAVLAYEHARGRAGNLPRATGARRAVMLGKSSPSLAGAFSVPRLLCALLI